MDILKDMWYQNNDVAMSWTNLKGEKNSPLLLCMEACLHHWKKKKKKDLLSSISLTC